MAHKLTDRFVRNAAPGFYRDGGCPTLNLRVTPARTRQWGPAPGRPRTRPPVGPWRISAGRTRRGARAGNDQSQAGARWRRSVRPQAGGAGTDVRGGGRSGHLDSPRGLEGRGQERGSVAGLTPGLRHEAAGTETGGPDHDGGRDGGAAADLGAEARDGAAGPAADQRGDAVGSGGGLPQRQSRGRCDRGRAPEAE